MTELNYHVGEADTRPWGRWQVIAVGTDYVIKEITVEPGHKLSLQRHQWRDEFWSCLAGEGRVTLDGQEVPFVAGSQVFIERGQTHRIEAKGEIALRFVEIQHGEKLSEDDIERLSDDYGRVS